MPNVLSIANPTLRSRVHGVAHGNQDGQWRQKIIRRYCRPGKALRLRPEPYDASIIGIWVKCRILLFFTIEQQIGHIDSHDAEEVAHHLRSGKRILAHISEVTGGTREKRILGVNIVLRTIEKGSHQRR